MARQSIVKERRTRQADPSNGLTNLRQRKSETTKELSKVTLYVRPDQVIAIEAIQLAERKRTGRRPDKSALVQEALDLLTKEYGKK